MFSFLRNVALGVLIGFASLGSAPAPALAQGGGLYLGFGSGDHGASAGLRFSDRGRHDYRDRDRGRHDARDRNRGRHEGRDRDRGRRAGFCSPREAVYKASRMGLRNPRVIASNHRVIRVEGRRSGQRYYTLSFANRDNCPVLR